MANYDLTQTGEEVQAYIDSIPVVDVNGTLSDNIIILATNPYSTINTNYSENCGSVVRLTVGNDVYLIPITEYDGSAYSGAVKSGNDFISITASSSSASGEISTISLSFSTGEELSDVGIDDTPTSGSDNLVESGGVYNAVDNVAFSTSEKVKNVGIDSTPTENSSNLIESGGVYDALAAGGGFPVPTVLNPVDSRNNSWVKSDGTVGTSSSSTAAISIYKVGGGKLTVSVEKTGSSATYVVSFGDIPSQTASLNVVSGAGTGGEYSGTFENYGYEFLYITHAMGYDVSVIEDVVTSDEDEYVKVEDISKTENVYHNSDDCVNDGGYVNYTTGNVSGNSGFAYSNYIACTAASTLNLTAGWTGNSGLCFYSKHKVFISGVKMDSQSGVDVTIPDYAYYYRFSWKKDSTISIIQSLTGVEGFVAYIDDIRKDVNSLYDDSNLPRKILMVGNSYTSNTNGNIADICSSLNIKNISIQYVYHGSASLQYWSENLDTTVTKATSVGTGFSDTTLRTLLQHDWDVVVFQQYSVLSGDYSSYKPYLSILINAVIKYCTNKNVKVGFNMTWGNPSGTILFSDIAAAVKQMRDDFPIVSIIIPAGTAIENIRGTSLNTSAATGFTGDNSHLAQGVGQYVASCALFVAILRAYTGKNIYSDTTSIASSGSAASVAVDNTNRELCQKAAVYAAINPWNVTDIENI